MFDFGDDLAGGHFGFYDVIGDVKGVEVDGGFFFISVCEDDDGDVATPRFASDDVEDFVAVHFGHVEIEEDDVGEEALDEGDAGFAVAGDLDAEAVCFEFHAVHLADGEVVFDDGDFDGFTHYANDMAIGGGCKDA